MRRLLVPVLVTAALAFPVAASADHHLMTVNEVMLSSGGNAAAQFVELLDPMDEPFPNTYVPYKLVAYDGSGVRVGGQDLGNPFMARDNTEPFVIASDAAGLGAIRDAPLTFGLPPAAGRVCFTRLAAEEPVNCIAYGCPPPQLPGVRGVHHPIHQNRRERPGQRPHRHPIGQPTLRRDPHRSVMRHNRDHPERRSPSSASPPACRNLTQGHWAAWPPS